MPVLITYHYRRYLPDTIFSITSLWENVSSLKAELLQSQLIISPIWSEVEFVHDFVAVLFTCKFDEDPIKTEGAIFPI